MLLTCAEWGSRVWGSDIDGRQMRGKKALKGMGGTSRTDYSSTQSRDVIC
jgi:tRNA G10  N-methylase Trm11